LEIIKMKNSVNKVEGKFESTLLTRGKGRALFAF